MLYANDVFANLELTKLRDCVKDYTDANVLSPSQEAEFGSPEDTLRIINISLEYIAEKEEILTF